MGLRVRKSISLCKGVRLNIGKNSMGLSFGTKGLRYSINSSGRRTSTVGIPGTGIYYTQSSTTGRRNYASQAYSNREQLRLQREQAKLNEIENNKLIVAEYNNYIEIIKSIHNECDDFIDWKSIYTNKSPLDENGMGVNEKKAAYELNIYRPNIFERLLKFLQVKHLKRLQDAVDSAKTKDAEEYNAWQNLHILSKKVLEGDPDAYITVIQEMNPLNDLVDFGSDFEFIVGDRDVIEIVFRVKPEEVVPNSSKTLTKTGKVSEKKLTKTAYNDLVQDYVCSCAIRIARDMFALLPINKVLVHATDNVLDSSTGHMNDVTILSVIFDKEPLNRLNFNNIDPSDALTNFNCNMKFLKTGGLQTVQKLKV